MMLEPGPGSLKSHIHQWICASFRALAVRSRSGESCSRLTSPDSKNVYRRCSGISGANHNMRAVAADHIESKTKGAGYEEIRPHNADGARFRRRRSARRSEPGQGSRHLPRGSRRCVRRWSPRVPRPLLRRLSFLRHAIWLRRSALFQSWRRLGSTSGAQPRPENAGALGLQRSRL